jgi:hypothetical protein
MLALAVFALVLVWVLVTATRAARRSDPGLARTYRSARPQLECLEGRWVPAVYEWTPVKGTDGANPDNWTCLTAGAPSVPPSDGTATLRVCLKTYRSG